MNVCLKCVHKLPKISREKGRESSIAHVTNDEKFTIHSYDDHPEWCLYEPPDNQAAAKNPCQKIPTA